MTNVNPINRVPFGQEKTRADFLARAAWEYAQASRLRENRRPVGYMALVGGHERAAKAYERAAENATEGQSSGGAGQTRAPINRNLAAYRRLVQKAIARCSKHPRLNHSLFDCVFEEVHGGAPFPTPQEQRHLEKAIHAAPRTSSVHARKKKIDHREAKRLLQADDIDFQRDFHELSSGEVQRILEVAKLTGYRKRRDALGSTARMYFQFLNRLR